MYGPQTIRFHAPMSSINSDFVWIYCSALHYTWFQDILCIYIYMYIYIDKYVYRRQRTRPRFSVREDLPWSPINHHQIYINIIISLCSLLVGWFLKSHCLGELFALLTLQQKAGGTSFHWNQTSMVSCKGPFKPTMWPFHPGPGKYQAF